MTGIGAAVLKRAARHWARDQRDRAEFLNSAPFGHPSNVGLISNSQMNISGAIEKEGAGTLQSSLGDAGMPHVDPKDDPQGLTTMIPFGDLPNCHPGFFYLLELRVYFGMENFNVIAFSGLRIHGGSAPRPLEPRYWRKWLTRLTYIGYCSERLLNRRNTISLASGPGNAKSVEVPPYLVRHLLRPGLTKPIFGTLNYAKDGRSLMDADTYMKFVTREAVLHVLGVVAQMDPALAIGVDVPRITSAFSYEVDVEDAETAKITRETRRTPQWYFAPGGSEDVEERRSRVFERLDERTFQSKLSMPSQLVKKDFAGSFASYLDGVKTPVASDDEMDLDTEEPAVPSIIFENADEELQPAVAGPSSRNRSGASKHVCDDDESAGPARNTRDKRPRRQYNHFF